MPREQPDGPGDWGAASHHAVLAEASCASDGQALPGHCQHGNVTLLLVFARAIARFWPAAVIALHERRRNMLAALAAVVRSSLFQSAARDLPTLANGVFARDRALWPAELASYVARERARAMRVRTPAPVPPELT
jgi:hypothetical protein